jgi:hypothetical protein
MPYAIVKTEKGYGIKNTDTGMMHSKDTTHEKAMAQMRLLEGIKHHTIDKKTGKTYRDAKP